MPTSTLRRLRTRLALRIAPWLRPKPIQSVTYGSASNVTTTPLWFDHT